MISLGTLHSWDRALFHAINGAGQWRGWEVMAQILSASLLWWGVALVVLAYGLIRRRRAVLAGLAACTVAVGISDGVSTYALKERIQRDRPCWSLRSEVVLRLSSCGGRYGFPSNHAANGMAAAVASTAFASVPAARIIFVLAGVVGLTRIYLGVHFPFDVLVGFGVGAGVGALVRATVLWGRSRRAARAGTNQEKSSSVLHNSSSY